MNKTEVPDGLCWYMQERLGGSLGQSQGRQDANFLLYLLPNEISDGVIDMIIKEFYESHPSQLYTVNKVNSWHFEICYTDLILLVIAVKNRTREMPREILIRTLLIV